MSASRIAARYSKSLIELAEENGRLDQVKDDMQYLNRLLKNRDFAQLMHSPVIPDNTKIRVINQVLGETLDELTLKFIILLINKQRESYLPDIIPAFIEEYKKTRNIATVRITSAHELSAESEELIEKKLRELGLFNGQIEMYRRVNPDLIGGFVLEYNDYIFDASVTKKLERLKKENFAENLYTSRIRSR
jgi:F-type H+-transporting ATPase subunit delta